MQAMFAQMIEEFGTIDILVNNAGLQQDARLEEMTLQQWNTVIGVNLTGQFLCAREAVKEFKRRGVRQEVSCAAGKIICISSVHEVIPWAGHVNYAASKGGVMLMMKSIAQEVAPHRIRVNSICPGAIRTPINTAAWEHARGLRRAAEAHPLQADRRARGHRPGGRVAGLGRGRLRHRHHALRRRRHDALSGLRGRRLRWPARSQWQRRRRSSQAFMLGLDPAWAARRRARRPRGRARGGASGHRHRRSSCSSASLHHG